VEKRKKVVIEIIAIVLIIVTVIFGGNEKLVYLLNQVLHLENFTQNSTAIGENGNRVIEDQLKIHYIDVGQGDSILIQNEDAAILIDGGTNESGDKLLKYLEEQGVETLNYVIATHPHEDHIGGLDEVISTINIVENVWMIKKSAATKTFENLVQAIKDKNIKVEQPKVGQNIQIGELKITTLGPVREDYEETNDWSIVLKIDYKNNSFILTGDAEKLAEKDIIDTGIPMSADILKIGHHGSSTSTTKDFLEKVKPIYAVISLGEDNSYGHPHTQTLKLLKQNNIIVYRTDRNGSIVATSDGDNISFEVEKGSKEGYTDILKATK